MARGIDERKGRSRARINRWLIVLAGAALVPAAGITGARAQVAAVQGATVGAGKAAGTIWTVAGGAGGPGWAPSVAVNIVCGVTSAGGSVYFAGESAARKVGPQGWLSTVAGTNIAGGYGDGGLARQAFLYDPCGLGFDHHGNLMIPDEGNYRVWVVAARNGTFYGQAMTAGDIYTVAVNPEVTFPGGVAAGPTGNLLIADSDGNRIREVTG